MAIFLRIQPVDVLWCIDEAETNQRYHLQNIRRILKMRPCFFFFFFGGSPLVTATRSLVIPEYQRSSFGWATHVCSLLLSLCQSGLHFRNLDIGKASWGGIFAFGWIILIYFDVRWHHWLKLRWFILREVDFCVTCPYVDCCHSRVIKWFARKRWDVEFVPGLEL